MNTTTETLSSTAKIVAATDSRSGAVWNGDSFLTRLLLAYCRGLPYFRGKGSLFQLAASVVFGGGLHVHNGQGVRIRIDPADYIGRTISFKGSFEPKSLALALNLMRQGGIFVDVGCNFGLYTLPVGVLPGAQCIAIDGSFLALSKLQTNLRMNPNVNATIVNCALASEAGLQCFELPSEGNLGAMRISTVRTGGGPLRFWSAGTLLQDVLKSLAPGGIKLLKIDVEGFELSVFKGLDFNGAFRPENLIVECDLDLFPDAEKPINYLVENGYEALTIEGDPVRNYRSLPENNIWCRDVRNERSARTEPARAAAAGIV